MGLIPPETLEAVRSKLDISELVSEYVPGLTRAGRNMKGRCPFHQERTPSFIVSPERQTFHCFGCGEGGDIFTFVMKLENLSFTEAVEKLAERAGVKIVETETLGPEAKERLKLKEVLEFAARHYREALLKDPSAEQARSYLGSRYVNAAAAEGFLLGYASRNGSLISAAMKHGFTADMLVKAGLAANREGRLREFFFDRVLYPVRDAKGAVVGMGGRTLGDGMPKYLNTPETPLFSKGRVLYGLFEGLGAIRKARRALLMEGYMDVIACHQHGITNACAPLGTALTQDHAALLKRYCSDVVLVFDADNAGLNAAVRGAEILLAAQVGVRIASVPSGKDPDEHLHSHGRESFEKCVEEAVDLVEFKTRLLISRAAQPLTPESKAQIAKDVLATIGQSADDVLKDEWVKRLAKALDVSADALRRRAISAAPAQRPAPPAATHMPAKPSEPLPSAEEQVLALMCRLPQTAAYGKEEDFTNLLAGKIWKLLVHLGPWDADWSSRFLDGLDPAERPAGSRLLVSELEATPEIVRDALERLRKRNRLDALTKLRREGKLSSLGLEQEYMTLLAESRRTKVL